MLYNVSADEMFIQCNSFDLCKKYTIINLMLAFVMGLYVQEMHKELHTSCSANAISCYDNSMKQTMHTHLNMYGLQD